MDLAQEFWKQHSEWSQATFGTDTERGPIGAAKHLRKEVDEVLAELDLQQRSDDPADPSMREDLLEEFADCLFLLFDAARRAGFDYLNLMSKAFWKLDKNRKRVWQKPTKGDEPVEHVRGIHD